MAGHTVSDRLTVSACGILVALIFGAVGLVAVSTASIGADINRRAEQAWTQVLPDGAVREAAGCVDGDQGQHCEVVFRVEQDGVMYRCQAWWGPEIDGVTPAAMQPDRIPCVTVEKSG
jgi:hypothetical protein